MFDHRKYQAFQPITMPRRRWPDQTITRAPRWCSVDLRDGNQALIEPMTVDQKMRLFDVLVATGFKEIEVGFPAASQPDFDFLRALIDQNRVPDDVTLQVLTQARRPLIERTFEALTGARRAIVHVYNSTSVVQREQVFKMDRAGIKAIAVDGARWVREAAARAPQTDWTFQYSPESFTGTELDFAVEVCDAVLDVWQPTADKPVILNLPATVEMATPNIYADQIEWFGDHISRRDAVIISLHTHNDRGCAVAASELGLLAGAQRVEGTLLGNGERTGNTDLVTMAMNLYSQGIDPGLDFSNMDQILQTVKSCTQLPVHPRHPYVGELVYTAFSGSHQDAIKKCLGQYREGDTWNAAYLPIDPRDLGRDYQEVIRINSQSGKGGVAYVLEQQHGLSLPRWLQIDFSAMVQQLAEREEGEVSGEDIWQLFRSQYVETGGRFSLHRFDVSSHAGDSLHATIFDGEQSLVIHGRANGVVEAFVQGLEKHTGFTIDVVDYAEHGVGHGVDKQAVAYVQVSCNQQRQIGVAIDNDIIAATLKAVVTAVNRADSTAREMKVSTASGAGSAAYA